MDLSEDQPKIVKGSGRVFSHATPLSKMSRFSVALAASLSVQSTTLGSKYKGENCETTFGLKSNEI